MLRLRGLPQGSLRKVKNNKTAPFPYRTSSMPAFGLGCCDRCHSYSSNNPLFFWTPPIYFWTTTKRGVAVQRYRTSGSDLGKRWPSRLVATARSSKSSSTSWPTAGLQYAQDGLPRGPCAPGPVRPPSTRGAATSRRVGHTHYPHHPACADSGPPLLPPARAPVPGGRGPVLLPP